MNPLPRPAVPAEGCYYDIDAVARQKSRLLSRRMRGQNSNASHKRYTLSNLVTLSLPTPKIDRATMPSRVMTFGADGAMIFPILIHPQVSFNLK